MQGKEGRQAQVSQLHVQMAEVKKELGQASKEWSTAHQILSAQVTEIGFLAIDVHVVHACTVEHGIRDDQDLATGIQAGSTSATLGGKFARLHLHKELQQDT